MDPFIMNRLKMKEDVQMTVKPKEDVTILALLDCGDHLGPIPVVGYYKQVQNQPVLVCPGARDRTLYAWGMVVHWNYLHEIAAEYCPPFSEEILADYKRKQKPAQDQAEEVERAFVSDVYWFLRKNRMYLVGSSNGGGAVMENDPKQTHLPEAFAELCKVWNMEPTQIMPVCSRIEQYKSRDQFISALRDRLEQLKEQRKQMSRFVAELRS